MSGFSLAGFTLPSGLDQPTLDGFWFEQLLALRTRLYDSRFGPGIAVPDPRRTLAGLTSDSIELKFTELILDPDGQARALAAAYLPAQESVDVAFGVIEIDPGLPTDQASHVLELGLDWLERLAASQQRSRIRMESCGDRTGALVAKTGVGGVDPQAWDVAPLVRRGFELEQIERVSVCLLDNLPDLDARLAAAQQVSTGYELVTWHLPTPPQYREALCRLQEAMSTDAPHGELEDEPEVWNEARLADFEVARMASGQPVLMAAARPAGGGELAGYTRLQVSAVGAAGQHDTLVSRAHRGHGLGMLLKLANLVALRDLRGPGQAVITFNAEENRPMLTVNEATGFEAVARHGLWQKTVVAH